MWMFGSTGKERERERERERLDYSSDELSHNEMDVIKALFSFSFSLGWTWVGW